MIELSERSIGSVVVALKAVDQVSGVIGTIQSAVGSLTGFMSKMGGAMGDVGNIINSAFSGFATGGPAGAALAGGAAVLGTVVEGIQSCVKEATASEAVWTSLAAAVTRSGTAWDTVAQGTRDALLSTQKFTVYSDEELAAALERLMTFGLSYSDAMDALGKAVDFASAKHMDLTSAATLVGKAMDGNTAILKRYGVDLATTKDQAAELKLAHDSAAGAIKALGKTVDDWVVSVTAAIGADSVFENGLGAAKDKAQYLVEQFQAGNIDLSQFTGAMQSLGVQLDEAKMKGGSATEVLAKLNEQFGGAAQANASTYAGLQERLKNATQEVSEKIGTMFLPALAGMTEAMLPVVDWLGKGVDAISAWVTEVGRMPEVKAATDAVSGALQGLWKWFGDLWTAIQEVLGPALQDLMNAFKDIWDALQPLGAAFNEIMAAFGAGGGPGGAVNLLRLALEPLVLFIKLMAVELQGVALVVGAFANAFKIAADFIAPIIKTLTEIIGGFLTWLRNAFDAFNKWLVGGSMWQDMWNALLSVASTMVDALLGDLGSKFFEPMKLAFTNAVESVKRTWDQGWQAVQTTFTTISTQIGRALNAKLEEMKSAISTSTSQYAPIATLALSGMQSAVNAGMDLIKGDWQGALGHIQDALTQFGAAAQGTMQLCMSNLEGAVRTGLDLIKGGWDTFVAGISSGVSTLQRALSSAGDSIQDTLSAVQSATAPATNAVVDAFTSAFDTVSSAATGLWNFLVGGSVWTDMLDEMQSQTYSALGNIVGAFQGMSLSIPATVPYAIPYSSPATGSAPAAPTAAPASASQVTVPVNVQVDGATVARTVERRLVMKRQLSAWRSG